MTEIRIPESSSPDGYFAALARTRPESSPSIRQKLLDLFGITWPRHRAVAYEPARVGNWPPDPADRSSSPELLALTLGTEESTHRPADTAGTHRVDGSAAPVEEAGAADRLTNYDAMRDGFAQLRDLVLSVIEVSADLVALIGDMDPTPTALARAAAVTNLDSRRR